MFKKIASILTVGVAALVIAAPTSVYALTPAQTKAKIAALKRQLVALPLHKAPFAKVNSLVLQLVTLDAKGASNYLGLGLPKIATVNAKKNAATLTSAVNKKVQSNKTLTTSVKKSIISKNTTLLKKYVPPGPNNPPYQAMLSVSRVVA